jgi:hypothetical protein
LALKIYQDLVPIFLQCWHSGRQKNSSFCWGVWMFDFLVTNRGDPLCLVFIYIPVKDQVWRRFSVNRKGSSYPCFGLEGASLII